MKNITILIIIILIVFIIMKAKKKKAGTAGTEIKNYTCYNMVGQGYPCTKWESENVIS